MKSPLSRSKARAALMEELEHAMRRSSAQGVIFGQTVANRAGISASDLECLDFLNLEGRVTAGRLAEVTGLTTGAITGVVDRLEQAGLVRRERDDNDRRKVFIATVPENIAKVGRFYEHLQRAMLKLWETYSDAELRLLLRFATQGYETMLAATEDLKAMMEAPEGKRAGTKAFSSEVERPVRVKKTRQIKK
jgi:DNA-binding MarR family transcriptional regulator